jgi:RNA polymerase sigma-70 factor (ECF subfamily)
MKGESRNLPLDPAEHLPLLIARMAERDEKALTEFYDLLSPTLYGLALKMMTDEQESQDVLQEAFTTIWREAGAYRAELGGPFAWAVMILRNKAIDRLHKRCPHEGAPMKSSRLVEAEQHYPGETLEPEGCAEVRAALSRLPAEQRRALELAFFSGMTLLDIAAQLGTSREKITACLRQGLIQMQTLKSSAR